MRIPNERGLRKLGSLIWLKGVKRTVGLRSESFHFSCGFAHGLLDRVGDTNTFPAVIDAEIRESSRPAKAETKLSTEQGPTRRVWLRPDQARGSGLVTEL